MARLNKKRCAVIAGAMLIAAVLAADYAERPQTRKEQ